MAIYPRRPRRGAATHRRMAARRTCPPARTGRGRAGRRSDSCRTASSGAQPDERAVLRHLGIHHVGVRAAHGCVGPDDCLRLDHRDRFRRNAQVLRQVIHGALHQRFHRRVVNRRGGRRLIHGSFLDAWRRCGRWRRYRRRGCNRDCNRRRHCCLNPGRFCGQWGVDGGRQRLATRNQQRQPCNQHGSEWEPMH